MDQLILWTRRMLTFDKKTLPEKYNLGESLERHLDDYTIRHSFGDLFIQIYYQTYGHVDPTGRLKWSVYKPDVPYS